MNKHIIMAVAGLVIGSAVVASNASAQVLDGHFANQESYQSLNITGVRSIEQAAAGIKIVHDNGAVADVADRDGAVYNRIKNSALFADRFLWQTGTRYINVTAIRVASCNRATGQTEIVWAAGPNEIITDGCEFAANLARRSN